MLTRTWTAAALLLLTGCGGSDSSDLAVDLATNAGTPISKHAAALGKCLANNGYATSTGSISVNDWPEEDGEGDLYRVSFQSDGEWLRVWVDVTHREVGPWDQGALDKLNSAGCSLSGKPVKPPNE